MLQVLPCLLTVISKSLSAPDPDSSNKNATAKDSFDVWGFSTPAPIDHDYTDCCRTRKVPSKCLGFCNVKNILEATTGRNPADCEDHFQDIVMCMAGKQDEI